jgi:hypothetical protein
MPPGNIHSHHPLSHPPPAACRPPPATPPQASVNPARDLLPPHKKSFNSAHTVWKKNDALKYNNSTIKIAEDNP